MCQLRSQQQQQRERLGLLGGPPSLHQQQPQHTTSSTNSNTTTSSSAPSSSSSGSAPSSSSSSSSSSAWCGLLCSSPVPTWLRSYIAAHSLPSTMEALRENALRLVASSGRVLDPGALRGPQGAPLTAQQLALLDQQFQIHSPQWRRPQEGAPQGSGGPLKGPPARQVPVERHLQLLEQQQELQQQQQQQDLQQQQQLELQQLQPSGATAEAADAGAASAPAAVAAAEAADEVKQLVLHGSLRGASCRVQRAAVPLRLGGPYEVTLGAPPAAGAAEAAGAGAASWALRWLLPLQQQWGPPAAARWALRGALRLLGPKKLGPPCSCSGAGQGAPLAWPQGGPQSPPCDLCLFSGPPWGPRL
ncbi:hypothetical protein ETH_00039685 [Eimeria tenella]|uniref:Uncharacterized protein n=1 Tax=Eimeria tenella TaxID=5802 RepID=U6KNM3_EIMTE|nr:hypothetical protein ETH_00039685 [Eimeria tenella]CDJ39722.1 hypothetical protein ETH_00039685 [Eimeria tenella]|eukprot:XP_013230475.1 hypothetical protein ETH_00039685 [Eimeria tenella]